jgi:hypothetical protein
MKRIILFIITFLSVISCRQSSVIPFEEVKNYFFRNGANIPDNSIVDSSERFQELFGAAAFMGNHGQPTTIDFDKEFVIAVVNPVTNCFTELVPESLYKEGNVLIFTYDETVGEEQSWSMQPVLLVKVDKKYRTDHVRLESRLREL